MFRFYWKKPIPKARRKATVKPKRPKGKPKRPKAVARKPTPTPAAPKPPFTPTEKGVPERAAKRTGKLTPEQIESKVYKYLKRHRGVLDVKKCARRLRVSEAEVEKAAEALVAKGKLKAEK